MELALFGALVIGISLGLLGTGGSILTVPILLFLMNRPEKLAITESLAIVGCISSIGVIPYALRGLIHWNSVLFFGIPGVFGACIGGCGTYFVSGTLQLTLFSIILVIASFSMLFDLHKFINSLSIKQSNGAAILEGLALGCLTGFIGVGGGFLLVPALVYLRNLSMTQAIGTSLFIISVNSLTGFLEQWILLGSLGLHIDWKTILVFSGAGMVGSLGGSLIAKKVPQYYLKKSFGISILVVGIVMIFNQF